MFDNDLQSKNSSCSSRKTASSISILFYATEKATLKLMLQNFFALIVVRQSLKKSHIS